jgi:nascent polypeptide-associated complex subunit beta
VNSNIFAIHGLGQEKDLTELVPGIIPQLGAETLQSLRKLAEAYQNQNPSAPVEADVPTLESL